MFYDHEPVGVLPNRRFRSKAERRRAFLDALRRTHSVSHAAAIVGVERTTPYYWRHTIPGFAQDWEQALSLSPPPGHRRHVLDLPAARMSERLLIYAVMRSSGRTRRETGHKISTPHVTESAFDPLRTKGLADSASRGDSRK